MRFLLSALFGAALLALLVFAYMRQFDGCLGRCGARSHCEEMKCYGDALPEAAAPKQSAPVKRKSRAHAPPGSGQAPAPLAPGDTVMATEGERTGRTEKLDLTDPTQAKELSAEEIDAVLARAEPKATRCITDALGDAPLEQASVKLHLRVEASGSVSRVAVDAPRLLLKNGLYRCLRGVAEGMRFPASGGASVVDAPYELK